MFSTEQPPVAGERIPASSILRGTRTIAVMRASAATDYAPVVEALINGGVLSVELTLSTPGVFEELPLLRKRFGDAVEFGVGTVTSVDDAERALDAGASYLVTPTTDTAVIEAAVRRGVAIYPGGLTPTELLAGWSAGATAVKVFPASVVGPGYVSALRGPFPDLQVVPSGGVDIDDAVAWVKAGALAVSVGGPLLGDAFKGGDLGKLTERAVRLRAAVDEAAAAL
ncbi:bifunctional 4-hydroxy-2-oxoglutarate aldolase/2-dehydro-3-deoxy-phosphogluconate aldolase [Arthrobacter sp. zg-Y859]|uniref:Bifunctional 4-hydroxy-2-oxoglutarate aldolase/2-dehydro-3-deoxy-phosphogluconate aldolase n=1 Tax=Arthrobacter jinronghuae TaxID=2964609 RepID=A0ABT1NSR7_9MICC|nr:bifunctional 4-hydroxy-2-oxoglutarate aldolase/2-dehydro-3-deoxy-phosphogluconate aldolase [Arthrobacter jinronghuae]MCQ1950782.1 bifunctional 4-hydroxy-2-oxoglutarate aldolase/2-dehydro-3-deoxy-phosphogluconate aldolase [Arthrobacter jinronghuae]UWX79251.1 bifunctional 4-hydroxy-2-oxoglutarate aldolase/2-dehydro-3-deoxy-phosphogluconate aldolase [Arthrobacter jinronghuae]